MILLKLKIKRLKIYCVNGVHLIQFKLEGIPGTNGHAINVFLPMLIPQLAALTERLCLLSYVPGPDHWGQSDAGGPPDHSVAHHGGVQD